jgi:murein DD-endopeptidase MepM/ murein hydrolase activator NlpD
MRKLIVMLCILLFSINLFAPEVINANKILDINEVKHVTEILNKIDSTKYNLLNLPIFPVRQGNKKIEVNSRYGTRLHPILKRFIKHQGIDISANYNEPILSSCNGIVVKTSKIRFGYGYHVIIKNNEGYEVIYAHLNNILVKEGDPVSLGQIIGSAGKTGLATGNHLHFEIRKDGKSIDPMKLLNCETENNYINTIYTLNSFYSKYKII